jgi:hypothetical protein
MLSLVDTAVSGTVVAVATATGVLVAAGGIEVGWGVAVAELPQATSITVTNMIRTGIPRRQVKLVDSLISSPLSFWEAGI